MVDGILENRDPIRMTMRALRLGIALRLFSLCVAALGFGMMTGCATAPDGHHSGDASTEYDNKPWSIPESWEGGGGMGGFGNQYQ